MSIVYKNEESGQTRFLGRVAPKARPLCLTLSSYVDASNVVLPEKYDLWTKAMPSLDLMMLNDQKGCCVITSKAHHLGLHTANDKDSGGIAVVPDKEVDYYYSKLKAGPGDSGCVMTDVLDYYRTKGMSLAGKQRKIKGYVSVNWRQPQLLKIAIMLFGGLDIGVNLPKAWADSKDNEVWNVNASKMVGGHCITACGWTSRGIVISTWGGLRTITWAAIEDHRFMQECYAVLSPDWTNADNEAPGGFRLAKLEADLNLIGGGGLPEIALPEPTPPVDPPRPPIVPPNPPEITKVLYDINFVGKNPTFGDTTYTGTLVPRGTKADFNGVLPDFSPDEFFANPGMFTNNSHHALSAVVYQDATRRITVLDILGKLPKILPLIQKIPEAFTKLKALWAILVNSWTAGNYAAVGAALSQLVVVVFEFLPQIIDLVKLI